MNKTPESIDEKSRALHALIAEKIEADPSLLQKAVDRIEYWRSKPDFDPRSLPYLDQWSDALDQGVDRVIKVLTGRDPQSAALRQASPFSGILSHKERFQFFSRWSKP